MMDKNKTRKNLDDATRARQAMPVPLNRKSRAPEKPQKRKFGYGDLQRTIWGNYDPMGIWGPRR